MTLSLSISNGMTPSFVGFLVSVFCIALLLILFVSEERRGARFLPHARSVLDRLIEAIARQTKALARFVHRDFLYQTVRYLFNVILKVLLRVVRFFEDRIQLTMRRNRLMAKRAGRARSTRNKLDEIAEHKASTVLTEEEKKKRLRESLR